MQIFQAFMLENSQSSFYFLIIISQHCHLSRKPSNKLTRNHFEYLNTIVSKKERGNNSLFYRHSGRHHDSVQKLCMELVLTISHALFSKYDVFSCQNFSANYCGNDPIKKM